MILLPIGFHGDGEAFASCRSPHTILAQYPHPPPASRRSGEAPDDAAQAPTPTTVPKPALKPANPRISRFRGPAPTPGRPRRHPLYTGAESHTSRATARSALEPIDSAGPIGPTT